jgi:hypothetical protein
MHLKHRIILMTTNHHRRRPPIPNRLARLRIRIMHLIRIIIRRLIDGIKPRPNEPTANGQFLRKRQRDAIARPFLRAEPHHRVEAVEDMSSWIIGEVEVGSRVIGRSADCVAGADDPVCEAAVRAAPEYRGGDVVERHAAQIGI